MMSRELIDIFSENLQRIMKERDKTQADLARYFSISSATASDWYNGKKMPRASKLQSLAPVTPSEPTQAILALQGLNLSEIYETLTKEEKRRFWRGIIKEIRFDKERNFFYIWR